jgi:DNA-binding SARP family transcriptional activator
MPTSSTSDGTVGVDIDRFHDACRKAKAAQDSSQAMGISWRQDNATRAIFSKRTPSSLVQGGARQAQRDYLSVLASIVDCHIMEREYDAAIETCTAYLELDPYAEDIYRELMRLYLFTGNRPWP